MNFTATEQQIKEIALKAILASKVIGMGVIQDRHFKNVPLTLDDIELDDEGLYIDYFRGRMVKLCINKEGDNIWEIRDSVDIEYQSWGETYSTAQDLVSSVIKKEEYNKVEESTNIY